MLTGNAAIGFWKLNALEGQDTLFEHEDEHEHEDDFRSQNR
jgi:hypothetical protein